MKLHEKLRSLLSILSINEDKPPRSSSWKEFIGEINNYFIKFYSHDGSLLKMGFDDLTSLPNRLLVLDNLKKTLAHAARRDYYFALLYIDIPHFNRINEHYSQAAGDFILSEFSKRITNLCRVSDTAGRISGDEFVVILNDIDHPQYATNVCNRLFKAIEEPFFYKNNKITVSANIGIAIYPEAGVDADEILKNARVACELSKIKGNKIFQFFTAELQNTTDRLISIEKKLLQAVKNNELYLNYQPQVDIKNNKIIGIETLCRWYNPEIGQVSPEEFIQVAEDNGLVIELSSWILTTAISQYVEWRKSYPQLFKDINFSINISPIELRNQQIMKVLGALFNQHDLENHNIQFEITEHSLLDPNNQTLASINFISKLNIGLSIDDFGTGYSSLFYLSSLPISEIKIDRSFIKDIPLKSGSTEVVCTIIQLAKNLQLRIIAEGVETQEQYDFLYQNNCDCIQGYYIKPPLTDKSFITFLKDYSRK